MIGTVKAPLRGKEAAGQGGDPGRDGRRFSPLEAPWTVTLELTEAWESAVVFVNGRSSNIQIAPPFQRKSRMVFHFTLMGR